MTSVGLSLFNSQDDARSNKHKIHITCILTMYLLFMYCYCLTLVNCIVLQYVILVSCLIYLLCHSLFCDVLILTCFMFNCQLTCWICETCVCVCVCVCACACVCTYICVYHVVFSVRCALLAKKQLNIKHIL